MSSLLHCNPLARLVRTGLNQAGIYGLEYTEMEIPISAPYRGTPDIWEVNTGLTDGEQIPGAYHATPTFRRPDRSKEGK